MVQVSMGRQLTADEEQMMCTGPERVVPIVTLWRVMMLGPHKYKEAAGCCLVQELPGSLTSAASKASTSTKDHIRLQLHSADGGMASSTWDLQT